MCDATALPPFIDTNGEWGDVCDRLYEEFVQVFKCNPRRTVLGKPLVYDGRYLDSDREEGFWHLVTKGKGGNRLFDPGRARRLSWLLTILDGTPLGLSRFSYIEGDGTKKLYFWLENDDYVLILAEKPAVVSLVTAFYIDQDWLKRDLAKKRHKGAII